MSREEKRPRRYAGNRDMLSAWIIFAVLMMVLVLFSGFDSTVL